MNVKQIQGLRQYLTTVYHSNRIKEQTIDKTYIDDTFAVPFAKNVVEIIRTGVGSRLVSSPAEHIITDNPQVFRKQYKSTEANNRVASELNRWAQVILRQNPQPYKETVKKLLGRGESWIYLPHNNNYKKDDPNDIPINYIILDPMIVFADIGEKRGVPSRVIVAFDRVASDVRHNYPKWTWPNYKNGSLETEKVPFFMYWDKDQRYFEADTEPLLRDMEGNLSDGTGLQENVYGFVPFVHSYSGFGEGSPDGDPANLAIGRIRKTRDLIAEYTALRSSIDYIVFQYAHPVVDITYDPQTTNIPPDINEKYSREPGSLNMLPIGPGGKRERSIDLLPDQDLYGYLTKLESDIDKEDPLGMVGSGVGTSGRQQDMAVQGALRKFDTVVENCAYQWATAFGMGLKIIEKLDMLPAGLKKGDINGNYECSLELKAKDPIEQDRLRTLGERLYMNGVIDDLTNLTRYQGYTLDEAQEIVDRKLAENVIKNSPYIAEILGQQIMKEIGLSDQLAALKAREQMMQETPPASTLNNGPQNGSQGGPPRGGNIQSPMGAEMADMSLAQRGQRRFPNA